MPGEGGRHDYSRQLSRRQMIAATHHPAILAAAGFALPLLASPRTAVLGLLLCTGIAAASVLRFRSQALGRELAARMAAARQSAQIARLQEMGPTLSEEALVRAAARITANLDRLTCGQYPAQAAALAGELEQLTSQTVELVRQRVSIHRFLADLRLHEDPVRAQQIEAQLRSTNDPARRAILRQALDGHKQVRDHTSRAVESLERIDVQLFAIDATLQGLRALTGWNQALRESGLDRAAAGDAPAMEDLQRRLRHLDETSRETLQLWVEP